jgi:cathepsin F
MRSLLRILILITLALYIITEKVHGDGDDDGFQKYQKFVKKHNKAYKNQTEMNKRFKHYKDNMERLAHLKNITEAGEGFKDKVESGDELQLDENEFSDLSEEEFKSLYLTLKVPSADEILRGQNPGNDTLLGNSEEDHLRFLQTTPTSYDWRTKGVVGPIKNQGQCGSCYTFAVAANLEGQYAIKYKKLLSFSEQQILNCDPYDSGCNGGVMANTFTYLKKSKGLGLTSSLKYVARKMTCTAVAPVTQVTGYKMAGTTKESTIATFLVNTGPLAAAVNANYFQYYRSGIMRYSTTTCKPSAINHAITLVGYGVSNGVNYWIVKNSWGATWGESGYIRVAWGTCGINTYVLSGTIA